MLFFLLLYLYHINMAMLSREYLNHASSFTASANSPISNKCAKSNEIQKKGWYNLQPEVLAVIFKFLDWPDRLQLDQVSRHWRNVMKSKQFLNVGVVTWHEYSKRWPKLIFDKLIYILAVVTQKIISGIDVESLIRPVIDPTDSIDPCELTGALELIRSWDHFKVVRFHDVERTTGFDYLMNVFQHRAFNLEELMIVVRKLDFNTMTVDLSTFQYLKKLDLMNCFPVNGVGDGLTTLSIVCSRFRSNHDFDSVTDMLIKCSSTLRTLKLCHFEIVGSRISTNKKSIIFPRLESLTIDGVEVTDGDLIIDLTESKLKHLNHVAYMIVPMFTTLIGVNFNLGLSVLSNEIESLKIKLRTMVGFMDDMTGICYPKLRHLDLEMPEGYLTDNESESIVVSVLDLLDNAENLSYIGLQDLIRSTKDLIRIVIKMKYLKRAFQVEVGSIDDTGTSFWGQLLEQLKVENIESNDCDDKIELKCFFHHKSAENDDLIGLLRDKYNIYGVGEYTGFDDPVPSDSSFDYSSDY